MPESAFLVFLKFLDNHKDFNIATVVFDYSGLINFELKSF